MAKTASAPALGKVDLWHKVIYPLLYLSVVIFFGSSTVYFGWENLTANREVERLKGELSQHAQQEQAAKDQSQWLRVKISKNAQNQKKTMEDSSGDIVKDMKDDVKARVAIAILLAQLVGLENIPDEEASKFGEEANELWEKAVKIAADEIKKEQVDFRRM
jgi:hypothetical protein